MVFAVGVKIAGTKQMQLKTIPVLVAAVLAAPAIAAEQGTLYPEGSIDKQALEKILPDKPPYSPYADLNFPARPLFGDTH
ncbi:MAG: hypothetical protein JJ992_11020, partial [Planctomycetes bacterium]|nr:hypothetical protein [Planctomycetota bacterium]